jgi:hypothetical protein
VTVRSSRQQIGPAAANSSKEGKKGMKLTRTMWLPFLGLIVITVIATGLAIWWNIRIWREPPEACELRTFDYVRYLDWVRKDHRDSVSLVEQHPKDSALREMLQAKAEFLSTIPPVVEAQISEGGATYGCTDEGYALLLNTLAVPTFRAMVRSEEIERLWERFERMHSTSGWDVFKVVFPPLLIAVMTGIGYLVHWRLELKKMNAPGQ